MAFMPKDISINVQEVLKRIPKDELQELFQIKNLLVKKTQE